MVLLVPQPSGVFSESGWDERCAEIVSEKTVLLLVAWGDFRCPEPGFQPPCSASPSIPSSSALHLGLAVTLPSLSSMLVWWVDGYRGTS